MGKKEVPVPYCFEKKGKKKRSKKGEHAHHPGGLEGDLSGSGRRNPRRGEKKHKPALSCLLEGGRQSSPFLLSREEKEREGSGGEGGERRVRRKKQTGGGSVVVADAGQSEGGGGSSPGREGGVSCGRLGGREKGERLFKSEGKNREENGCPCPKPTPKGKKKGNRIFFI